MKASKTIKTAQLLFYLNALIWFVLGLVSWVSIGDHQAIPAYLRWTITLLMFGNASFMLFSGWGLGRGSRWLYLLALGVLAANIILTFTDQVGTLDWITLVIDLLLLGILITIRKKYL